MSKIKVKTINFPFSESSQINTKKVFTSWDDAELHLRLATPPKLGYYKTDFLITFEDGAEYKGRYDIGDESGLRHHVVFIALTYSGRHKPYHFSDEQWEAFKKENTYESYGELLDKYEIEYERPEQIGQ